MWRSALDDRQLDAILNEGRDWLLPLFLEGEVVEDLQPCCGDKAPGPDCLNMAFWQHWSGCETRGDGGVW